MKTFITLSVVGYASAVQTSTKHDLVSSASFSDRSHPPSYDWIGALGESFHNAFKNCQEKTNDWIIDDLRVEEADLLYSNSYAVEYKIKSRVRDIYNAFRELLGEDNYWQAPNFTSSDKMDTSISWGGMGNTNLA
jgi:hypothetical protein